MGCASGDLTRLRDLWTFRGGSGQVTAAWKVDNPLLTYKFKQRREALKAMLGREADMLEGFHGTAPANVLSIVDTGFDKGKRGAAVGQVHGSGEYFAKDPSISVSYCRGGNYMLVCRLTLGVASTYGGNSAAQDGDHVWVPSYGGSGCYVIAEPDQILPQFIVQFAGSGSVSCSKLDSALASHYSTKPPPVPVPVPARQRDCKMSREAATVLWMGFLHAHFSDDDLRQDVRKFLETNAAGYMQGAKIQIVKGHFKKAHAILQTPIPRALVHRLNSAPFNERGTRRTICVEDGHGSPGQPCPRFIAGYCRGQNLRFTHPCFCSHPERPTARAGYTLEPIDMSGAKGMEICDKFMASAPFHTGYPKVVGIKAIKNPTLSRCHDEYRKYLTTKHMDEPAEQELYHGTNNNILDVLYTHGLQPPSDMLPAEDCPVSGGKGLCTSICDASCKKCVKRHEWNKCHMYGLGIYLADLAQKSNRYVSQPSSDSGRKRYRMVLCSVLMGRTVMVDGYLRQAASMHDVSSLRRLWKGDLDAMCEPCDKSKASLLSEGAPPVEQHDLMFVKGLGSQCKQGFSVVNSEYLSFHPYQCLPRYEIIYEIS